jgi:hypothetical protein
MKLQRYDIYMDCRCEFPTMPSDTGEWVKASDAEAIINKLKCCGNCKHNYDADEENCQGCCEPKLERWEMIE